MSASGPEPANFNTIGVTTGTYNVGPTTVTNQAGDYTIQVTAVTVDSIIYGTSPALVEPSSFSLTVVNPCSGTTVTSTSVSTITLKVWDSEQLYPNSAEAFPEFEDSISTANNVLTMCAKTYTATTTTNTAGNSLTTFLLDTGSKKFRISS